MPEELLKDSELYSDIVCSLMGVYFLILPEVPPLNQLESSEQPNFNSNANSETGTSAGNIVSIVTKGRTRGEATYALKRPRVGDQGDSHTPPHLEPTLEILPASVVVEVSDSPAATTDTHTTTQLIARNHLPTNANPTGKRKRTRDGGKFFEFLTFMVCKVADVVIDDNYPHWDSSAESDVSTDVITCPQPKQHNVSESLNTLPDEQVTTFNDGNEGSEMRSRYSVPVPDNHNPPAPQLSRQDGPEHGTLTTTDVDQPLTEDYQAPYEDNANFHDIDRAGAMTQQDILTMPYTVGINGI
jgi:hypothetical protein